MTNSNDQVGDNGLNTAAATPVTRNAHGLSSAIWGR